MALSSTLHSALKEFAGTLDQEDDLYPLVVADVRTLRHAETDGLAEYENAAAQILRGHYQLLFQHQPENKPQAMADDGKGGDGVAVKK